MAALLFFLLRLSVSPFRSISRLEAENAELRRQLRASTPSARSGPVYEQRSPVLPPIVSVVSIDREGNDDRPARDAGAMASCGLPPLLAPEVPEPGRPATIDAGLRALIRRMSIENTLWGAPRIQSGAQARLCGRSVDRDQVHGRDRRPPVWSELGHLLAQPSAADCSHGPVRGPDHRL